MNRRTALNLLILIGGAIPGGIVLEKYYAVPTDTIVVVTVLMAFVFSWLALWYYASSHEQGDEWWQDDSCSGWRGY